MFTKDQRTHLRAVKGVQDETGLSSFADRLQEEGHPLAPLFARAHAFHQTPLGSELHDRYAEKYAGTGDPFSRAFWRTGYHTHASGDDHLITGSAGVQEGKKIPMGLVHRGNQVFIAPLTREEIASIREKFPTTQQEQGHVEQLSRPPSMFLRIRQGSPK